jgi:hypothetical protein
MIKATYWKPTCDGCSKAVPKGPLGFKGCSVYFFVPNHLIRAGACAFNPPVLETAKKRVRVGQQKQRRLR